MKTIISTFAILIIIISTGFLTLDYLQKETRMFTNELTALEEYVAKSDWSKASKAYEDINEKWKTSYKRYLILIDHYEIDNINMCLAELKAFIDTENDSLALAKISNLKLLLKHIPNKETLTIENIL